MKSLNNKERSKQVWIFLGIFFGLCIVPVSLIFFSYYVVPEQISDAQFEKLRNYASFEQSQKSNAKLFTDIDENLAKLRAHNAGSGQEVLFRNNITQNINKVSNSLDSSTVLLKVVITGYQQHLADLINYNELADKYNLQGKALQEAQSQLQVAKATLSQTPGTMSHQ